jgi:integrase/recombinase XerD
MPKLWHGRSFSVKIPDMTPEEARTLAESWTIHLEAERKSPHTIRGYTDGLRLYIDWCERDGRKVELQRRPVEEFTAWQLAHGRAGRKPGTGGNPQGREGLEANTVIARLRGIRRFSAWYCDETGEPDQLGGMKPPKTDDKVPDAITSGQLAALQATCRSRDFYDLRDKAIISVMIDSMVRAEELLSMTVKGTDLRQRTALIVKGKGGKGRVVAFSAQAARDLDRYLRARAQHRLAAEAWLWLPIKRTSDTRLTYGGLYTSLRRRALRADPPFRLTPHMMRRGGAINWRRKGGSVTSLMALGGWTDISMVQKYLKAAESELAVEEARRLFDGEG